MDEWEALMVRISIGKLYNWNWTLILPEWLSGRAECPSLTNFKIVIMIAKMIKLELINLWWKLDRNQHSKLD